MILIMQEEEHRDYYGESRTYQSLGLRTLSWRNARAIDEGNESDGRAPMLGRAEKP